MAFLCQCDNMCLDVCPWQCNSWHLWMRVKAAVLFSQCPASWWDEDAVSDVSAVTHAPAGLSKFYNRLKPVSRVWLTIITLNFSGGDRSWLGFPIVSDSVWPKVLGGSLKRVWSWFTPGFEVARALQKITGINLTIVMWMTQNSPWLCWQMGD